MTHEYTLLLGGTILRGVDEPSYAAIAWAEGTVLALGTDEQVRAVSRGDSEFVNLHGAYVVPVGPDETVAWPPTTTLEIGSPADLAILLDDPRRGPDGARLALGVLVGGHVVRGTLPGRTR
jgi:hypothetical protein